MSATTGAIVGRDVEVELAGASVQGSTNNVALQPAADSAEVAAFGDDWVHRAATVKRWEGTIRAIYSEDAAEAMEALYDAWESMAAIAAVLTPKGTAAANWQWSGDIVPTMAPVEVDRLGGVVTAEFPWVGTGTLSKGTVVLPLIVMLGGSGSAQIRRSVDSGESWAAQQTLPGTEEAPFSFADAGGGVVLCGANQCWRSIDYGQTFVVADSGPGTTGYTWLMVMATNGNVVAAHNTSVTNTTQLWLSVDGGQNYSAVLTLVNAHPWFRSLLRASDGTLYTAYSLYGTPGGKIEKSIDHGASWSVVASLGDKPGALAIAANGNLVVANLFGGIVDSVIYSPNGGAAWYAATVDALAFPVLLTLANGQMLAGTDAGLLYRSINYGVNWSPDYDFGTGEAIWALAELSDGTLLANVRDEIYRSTNGGSSWTLVDNDLGQYYQILEVSN